MNGKRSRANSKVIRNVKNKIQQKEPKFSIFRSVEVGMIELLFKHISVLLTKFN